MGRDRDSSGDDDMGVDASGRFSGDDRDSDHEDGGGRRGRGRGRERRERRRGGRDEGRRQSGGGQRREWKYDPSLVWSCLSNNPHVAQGHMGQTDATKAIPQSTASFRRTLVHGQADQTDGDTRGVYRRRVGELKTAVQWLQRNYLITEIEFLTQHGYPHCTVVIAGSAPATHVKFLSQLFPDATFHLFSPPLPADYIASSTSAAAAAAAASSDDAAASSSEATGSASQPNPPAIVSTDRIRVHAEPFSDAIAAQFAGAHALFVSELRSGDPLTDPLGDPETKVAGDMEAQVRWARLMRAHKCLLRFRLPWTAGQTQYLDGEVCLHARS
jgi:hypothetical protein